ncbi:MAG: hypothetical protein KVP17_003786 [Porospora cf. gigantea B]|uniref:uncharacterized protein n=1 Tax=Porospora cf. gigantea B TaxID=2853592 RepID=UPI003571BFCD|nr:MAG: hypothetical protein KVP17_003786 [Porospora cf. gigantea B]
MLWNPMSLEAKQTSESAEDTSCPSSVPPTRLGADVARVSVSQLNQSAMDFDGNLARVKTSIDMAKASGSKYRLGPELELSGYSCEDHFLEMDTIDHCWESLASLISTGATEGILCDVGMPVVHRSVRYNCRVFVLNGEVLLIRPKVWMANDGEYHEPRYFAPWATDRVLEKYHLPDCVRRANHSAPHTCPIGIAAVQCLDASVCSEICEELWTPNSTHIDAALDGVDIISNGSGSHFAYGKIATRISLVVCSSAKTGAAYLYANQMGCDGTHLFYDGSSCIAANGKLVAIAPEGSYAEDVIVLTENVDLARIRSQRVATGSFAQQASTSNRRRLPRVNANIFVTDVPMSMALPSPMFPLHKVNLHEDPETEMAATVPLWLFDYLRKTGGSHSGFYLTVSSAVEPVAMLCMLATMTENIFGARKKSPRLYEDAFTFDCSSPQELMGHMVHCSSLDPLDEETLAFVKSTGATYHSVEMCGFIEAQERCFRQEFDEELDSDTKKFIREKGEELLSRKVRQRVQRTGKTLFVLNLSSLDDFVDCTTSRVSSDITPMGGVSRTDLHAFIARCRAERPVPLVPLTFSPLVHFTTQQLRDVVGLKMEGCLGPVSLFRRLLTCWYELEPTEVAEKVKVYYASTSRLRRVNQPNSPMLHMDRTSHDGYHSDLRPIIYASFARQFRAIDELAELYVHDRVSVDQSLFKMNQKRVESFSRLTTYSKSPGGLAINRRLSRRVFSSCT